ncbi:uncharacterized protein LY79DRAFT_544867, partial [Colletotrichum navitas]
MFIPSWLSIKTALHVCIALTACNQPNHSSSPSLAPIPPPFSTCSETLLVWTASLLPLLPRPFPLHSSSCSGSPHSSLRQITVQPSTCPTTFLFPNQPPCRSLALLRPVNQPDDPDPAAACLPACLP